MIYEYNYLICLANYILFNRGNISQGNVHKTLPTPTPVPVVSNNYTISSGSGQDSGHTPRLPYTPTNEITLSSDGPHLLIYFFADEAVEVSGFNISYWYVICPFFY